MKTFLFVAGQLLLFALFIVIFFGGGLLALFHLDPFGSPHWFLTHPTPDSSRYFLPTGLILMTLLYLVVVGIEAGMKKLRTAGLWTTVAFVIALIFGLIGKFGWVQPS